MKATIQWQGEVAFLATAGSGHQILMDGAPDQGGQNQGARPMEMVLLGLGGCSAFDVVTILRKARQDITDCQVTLSAERADTVPAVFTHIHMHFAVVGKQLKEAQVARAVSLSAEKYCSASKMLMAGGVNITHDFAVSSTD